MSQHMKGFLKLLVEKGRAHHLVSGHSKDDNLHRKVIPVWLCPVHTLKLLFSQKKDTFSPKMASSWQEAIKLLVKYLKSHARSIVNSIDMNKYASVRQDGSM